MTPEQIEEGRARASELLKPVMFHSDVEQTNAQRRSAAELIDSLLTALSDRDRLAEQVRRETIEECIQTVEAVQQDFLSPRFATPQPIGSISERFACGMVIQALRALSGRKNEGGAR